MSMTDLEPRIIEAAFTIGLAGFVLAALIRAASSRKDSAGPPALPVGKVHTWGLNAVDLLGMGLVFLVYFGFHFLNLSVPDKEVTHKITAGALVVTIGVQFTIAGMIALFLAPRVRLHVFFGLRWPKWPWVVVIAPATVIGMWLLFGGMAGLGYFDWMEKLLGESPVQDVVKILQEAKDPLVIALMATAAIVVAPLCEEMVFRGYFYPVAKRFGGPVAGALCSALVFSAAHGSLPALLPLFLFGLALVVVYEKTGSLWAPIACHCCFNSATVAVQLAARYLDLPLQTP